MTVGNPDVDDPTIAGLVHLSTCDWPGHLVATAFLQGCPWQCTYCQNPDLIDPRTPGALGWNEVQNFLTRRRGLLDGLVFSGGEPTRQPGLAPAAQWVREQGFGTGLHTAGAYPARLATVLPLLDWVGLDIKALPDDYPRITGVPASADRAFTSLRLVVDSGVDHEIRITVDPTVHTADHVHALVQHVRAAGAGAIVLQEARSTGTRPGYADALGGRGLRDVVDVIPEGVSVRTSTGQDRMSAHR
ncbi:MAG: anaerobic ribonucleoside-triphosphate reductase activating protein [Rhodococcus sp.]|uniref:anaerobic ribonucleoside-triphosphate reductase activating protein n=1 Tax=Rhodococcus sp. TaxID=1831 RepID=UPI0016971CF6|nr:anaerobic ribonucleoside-triphosphate reductase activating protein [Rhodococcus sp. (in: high G+C Gram-positive bacteria)]NLV78131.1 anaerobic ribonucleoside-triphosphate reductase activating protein [Rhodococcus sp. (in: high G+C Gram-positive bacteria)]